MSIVHRPYDDQIFAIQKEIHRLYTTVVWDDDLSVLEKLDYASKIRQIGMIIKPQEERNEVHDDNRHHRAAEYIPKP